MAAIAVRRARFEEVRPLAAEYLAEQEAMFGRPTSPPLPQGGVFWVAEDPESGQVLGYAAGTLRPEGCTIGPIFTRSVGRRRGTGAALLSAIVGGGHTGAGHRGRGERGERRRRGVPPLGRLPPGPHADGPR